MNLNHSPTKAQLRALLAQGNDRAGNHVLWVAKNGDVHLETVANDLPPAGIGNGHPEMQLRYETFLKGNEYVGPQAAQEEEWVSQLFESLVREWPKVKGKNEVGCLNLW